MQIKKVAQNEDEKQYTVLKNTMAEIIGLINANEGRFAGKVMDDFDNQVFEAVGHTAKMDVCKRWAKMYGVK